jgi:hypothetical protein
MMPRDVHTRERLRAAQQAEARAVTAVCTAQASLAGVSRKRDATIAAANSTVTTAENALARTQAALVDISGLDRAAALLGIDKATLRRAVATTTSHSDGDQA